MHLDALRGAGLGYKVIVTGQDADLAACQRIARGTQSMTVYKPLKNLAVVAAKIAVNVAKGEPVPAANSLDNGARQVPTIFQKVISVDKDNLMSTVVADGFHTEAELR